MSTVFVKHGRVLKKVYLYLFTCGVIRAVYLEIVERLSTLEFLLCFEEIYWKKGDAIVDSK